MKKPVKEFTIAMIAKYDAIIDKLLNRYNWDMWALGEDIRFWNAMRSQRAWKKIE